MREGQKEWLLNPETDPGAVRQMEEADIVAEAAEGEATRQSVLVDLLNPLSIGQEGGEINDAMAVYLGNIPERLQSSMTFENMRSSLLAQAKSFAKGLKGPATEADAERFDGNYMAFLRQKYEQTGKKAA